MEKAVVLGMGVSGTAAAGLLRAKGYSAVCIDRKEGPGIQSDSSPVDWEGVSLLVISPGVPKTHPVCLAAKELGIAVKGEAELALPHFRNRLLAVTGTNGKTTVTLLTEHILKTAGIKARAVGNVGVPLSSLVGQVDPEEILVIELSSFQLEELEMPLFDRAVLLNITPDHLDRHGTLEEYARAKCQIARCMKEGAPLFVSKQVLLDFGHLLPSARLLEEIPITASKCDLENAQAAWALTAPYLKDKEVFWEGLRSFKKPPHRIEWVQEIGGVAFYDDSKGTNLDAVIQAVAAMERPIILIAGGVDKGAPYTAWKEPFRRKVKKTIAIGEAAQKIRRELGEDFDVEIAPSLSFAVETAFNAAAPGDCVLLSPGCSSYDMFRDYAHRGEEFRRAVARLTSKGGS
ncbi:MAG: UDP-N-acetylmuramoyl-L-alanine--D-glutamate ligase [Verrucomicrobia bacterium]|nr:UDP-N-acetylmuramoyl-L-alanine--D-glutamate ligase [Verrucomicrobiota bacterium]